MRKQCIGNTAVATPRRRITSLLTYGPPELVPVFDPEANQTILMRRERLANISEPAIVRTPPRRIPLAHAATFAPFLYLGEEEVRRLAIRFVNRLNKKVFKNASRRKRDPKRLTAFVCEHDRGTRRHLHCLFAMPADISLDAFTAHVEQSLDPEPFASGMGVNVQRVLNLAASVNYNLNDGKSLVGDALVYM